MNNYQLITVFILSISLLQVNAQSDKEKDLSGCQNTFYNYKQTLKNPSEGEFNFQLNLYAILRCGVELATQGDDVARNIILDHFSHNLSKLSKTRRISSSLKDWVEYYGRLELLENMAHRNIFDLGMRYFSQNVCALDFSKFNTAGDSPDTNFGMLAYENLLEQVMSEEDKLRYGKIYSNLLLKRARSNDGKDPCKKKIQAQLYPIIKADWEAGKIKLKSDSKDKSTSSSCEELFFNYYEIIEGNPKNLFDGNFKDKLPADFDLAIYLKCGSNIAANGNKIVEEFLQNYLKNQLAVIFKKETLTSTDIQDYLAVIDLLEGIPSTQSFDVGMQYFSHNISVSDIINIKSNSDTPDTNLGMTVYSQLLFPMMTEEMQQYYQKAYQNVFFKYVNLPGYETETNQKKFHELFYPIIKADWEAGKIKLKSD